MILLRKRTDYYDYLIGIYGRDEKKVYDRKLDLTSDEIYFEDVSKWRNTNIFDLYVCNRMYRVEQVKKGVWELHKFHKVNTDYAGQRRHYRESQVSGLNDFEYYIPRPSRMMSDSPICIKGTFHRQGNLEGLTPILSTFGIPSVLDAVELYSEVDMYISNRMTLNEVRSEQSDENKLLSKGFDDKISFRHRK
jgi:hypothetical protein